MAAVSAAFPAATASTTASLYVGDLHPDVTEGMLFEAFAEFKSLASVRLCKDASTGRSLCYGYVNFLSHHDANHAIKEKNHTTLNGKAIRVMWSVRDPDARRSGVGNIFVKNLPESINNAGLEDMFQKFGYIISCKVASSEDGKSRGYGFVQFGSEESALAAIENLNGSTVGDKEIYVGKFVKKSDRALATPDVKYTNLYMKNLDINISEDMLREKFSEFGKIVSLVIAEDEDGTSKGFAFVNFDNPEDARRAAETMNGAQLGSKTLYVARAQKKAEREQLLRRQFEDKRKEQTMKYKGSNVYVKNIDDIVTDEELREHFSQCGNITSSKLMRDDKGTSKGFGFVCFSTPEEAIKAVNTFHGRMFRRKPLYVAIAQRKEDRKLQLQRQYAKRMSAIAAGSSTAAMPGTYPQLYYTNPPSSIVSQMNPQAGLVYQSLVSAPPTWKSTSLIPSPRPTFQAISFPMAPNAPTQNRQNRGRMNSHAVSYVPHMLQSSQLLKDFTNQQQYNSRGRGETKRGSATKMAPETLSKMLSAASPEQQKQILGEQLFPLVEKLQPGLAGKITGMLLEMDNSELLLLMESPECLAVRAEEAVNVLNASKASGQDAALATTAPYLSSEVAVN
ncbi:PREDICTED: polyadenylate-binding protein 7 isoform X2 [Tarenaya hassleriana]|uniref:polyadenylate-binding protein 7 isoform X2 n=1 Tax=Tarenaya hassleriana TaxID=28532 RepID=UPI00053C37BF|nr:PREDICTED: polyadenylate-binding protein 7 isoform X2 [Tarenaya hassleriana]